MSATPKIIWSWHDNDDSGVPSHVTLTDWAPEGVQITTRQRPTSRGDSLVPGQASQAMVPPDAAKQIGLRLYLSQLTREDVDEMALRALKVVMRRNGQPGPDDEELVAAIARYRADPSTKSPTAAAFRIVEAVLGTDDLP